MYFGASHVVTTYPREYGSDLHLCDCHSALTFSGHHGAHRQCYHHSCWVPEEDFGGIVETSFTFTRKHCLANIPASKWCDCYFCFLPTVQVAYQGLPQVPRSHQMLQSPTTEWNRIAHLCHTKLVLLVPWYQRGELALLFSTNDSVPGNTDRSPWE